LLGLEGIVIRQGTFGLRADLTVGRGARVALIGPSGAGKSTLLGLIAGFVPSVEGRVTWAGADLGGLPPGKRPVSILFQDQNLFPHLSVAENVALGIDPALRLSRADRARVDDALARVGLGGFGARRPGTLSGGEQGRVALARALLRARPILLLDEPFAALGPGLKAGMLDLVAELTEETGATLLMVSHDPGDALRICPETILVADGMAHAPVPTAALLADPPPVLAEYLGKAWGRAPGPAP
jgi:thiamine transport system ATP-binding protein